jgi:hypothetical protein
LRLALGHAEARFRKMNHPTVQLTTTKQTPSELSLALRDYLRQRRAA